MEMSSIYCRFADFDGMDLAESIDLPNIFQ